MVLVRRQFFHYDPVRCGVPTLYGTVSERAAKTIRFNTLWQWKGYPLIDQCNPCVAELLATILLSF